MFRMLLILGLLMAGCASDPTMAADEEQAVAKTKEEVAAEIEAILTQPIDEEEYGEGERCISTYQYDSVEVLDNKHVVFRGRGDNLWVNTLRAPCIGLRRRDVLKFELRGSQLCSLDDFVAISQNFGFQESSARCALGEFAPVTEEQIDLVEAAVGKKARKKKGKAQEQ